MPVFLPSRDDLFYFPVYWAFRIAGLLPLRILYFISDGIFFLAFYILRYRKMIVMENLRNSFPDKSASEIHDIAKSFYSHLCDLIVESIYQTGMGENEIRRRVRYNNVGIIEKYYKEGKHVAAVLGHYGNWEWMCGFPLVADHESIIIYRHLKSKTFNRLMFNLRSRFGGKPVPMKMAIRKIFELDKKGVPTITAFMADQAPPKEKALYWTGFLNQDTPVYLGVEQIARKMDMAVVYFKMKKIRRGYYEFDLIPLFDNSKDTSVYEITAAHVSMLEKQIIQEPGYWLWSHRRWKIKR
ncbi:MAG: lysophospholipid acyltransferase family protein [Bacteroidales bacterium]